MALGAILGAALTDHSSRAWALWVGGLDVVNQPGASGNGYGVSIDSVEVTEGGVNGVSSMKFVIDDPQIQVTVSDGYEVRFQDLVNDVPEFFGWVQSWSYINDFGDQGRRIEVQAIGCDVVLDWACLTTDVTITCTVGTLGQGIQSVVAACAGVGALRVFDDGNTSSQAFPLGHTMSGSASVGPLTITAGTSLRTAIKAIFDAGTATLSPPISAHAVVVDFYFGLRTFEQYVDPISPGSYPTDWVTLTITDTPAGAVIAESLSNEVNAAEIVRGVVVTGGNAAGSGLVLDGTGKPGRIVPISDSTSTTGTARDAIGFGYIATFSVGARGSFWLRDHVSVYGRHAGGKVIITDTRTSQSSATYSMGEIVKSYEAVLRTWRLSFGGREPSAIHTTRRLTRAVLN